MLPPADLNPALPPTTEGILVFIIFDSIPFPRSYVARAAAGFLLENFKIELKALQKLPLVIL